MFLAESRERSSRDGTSCGSPINSESQEIEKTVLSTTVAELHSVMKMFWFMPVFSVDYGWTFQVKLQNIHMRTDAKNLVTTARTIHLLEQKNTIQMNSMLQKGSLFREIFMILHTFPTQNCLADCLTKGISEGRQLDHSSENRQSIRC